MTASVLLRAVADEGERERAAGVVLLAQQLHPERLGVEAKRALEVTHPDHRVQDSHGDLLNPPFSQSPPAAEHSGHGQPFDSRRWSLP